ncbi:MAG: glycosyl hydrolase, partial [Muribaculaceae bacterium]|nr:glycosyl hydrolase [Muribaculaceae bacterium]
MKIKNLIVPATIALMVFAACSSKKNSDGVIRTDIPERVAGQEDMIGFAADPIDTVRVGFIGLGMRGPGAVDRFAHIPGTKVVALCDIDTAGINKSQRYLTRAGLPEAAVYTGSDT